MRTSILKWANDERALEKTDDAHEEIGFEKSRTMSDSHTRTLISMFSHDFALGDICYEVFDKVINQRMEAAGDKLVCDKELLSEENVSNLSEWLLIAFVMHVAGEIEELLGRFHRDVQSITQEEAGMLDGLRVDIEAAVAFI